MNNQQRTIIEVPTFTEDDVIDVTMTACTIFVVLFLTYVLYFVKD